VGSLFLDAGARRRFGTGFWALADQGAVSLGNFMTQIILARSLRSSEYGVFALIFGVLLFLLACQSGLVAYPLSLEGAVAGKVELRKIAFTGAILTVLLAIPFSVLVIGATVILHVVAIIWAVLLAMLLWQLQETFRRALMAHLRHNAAIWGDVLSYGGQALIVWLLARSHGLTLQRIFLVIALTSAAAACLQSLQIGWSAMPLRAAIAAARKYWSTGKWALLSGMNESGIRQVFPWVLALVYSPAEAAAFQAVMNVVGVSHPVVFGTVNVLVPAAAETKQRSGTSAAFRTSCWYGTLAAVLVIPFFLLLLIWSRPALVLFYGHLSPYLNAGLSLRLASVAYILAYGAGVLVAFLYGVDRAKFAFAASIGGTLFALLPCAFLIWRFGVPGAVAGIVVLAAGKLLIGGVLSARTVNQDEHSRISQGPLAERSGSTLVRNGNPTRVATQLESGGMREI
jgi:O-antigen/teichoic acid export membrane protein